MQPRRLQVAAGVLPELLPMGAVGPLDVAALASGSSGGARRAVSRAARTPPRTRPGSSLPPSTWIASTPKGARSTTSPRKSRATSAAAKRRRTTPGSGRTSIVSIWTSAQGAPADPSARYSFGSRTAYGRLCPGTRAAGWARLPQEAPPPEVGQDAPHHRDAQLHPLPGEQHGQRGTRPRRVLAPPGVPLPRLAHPARLLRRPRRAAHLPQLARARLEAPEVAGVVPALPVVVRRPSDLEVAARRGHGAGLRVLEEREAPPRLPAQGGQHPRAGTREGAGQRVARPGSGRADHGEPEAGASTILGHGGSPSGYGLDT